MNERKFLESYYSVTHDKQARISYDKYHYIVDLFENDKQTITELFSIDRAAPDQAYVDATYRAEEFVKGE